MHTVFLAVPVEKSKMIVKDSVFLVTGGASGLGKGTVEKLLSEGATVVVLDLQLLHEDETLRSYNENVLFLQVDVTSEKEVLNAIDLVKRKFGKLNGVINCAGILVHQPVYDFQKQEAHSLQEFTTIININLIGTFNVIRLAIPLLNENEPNEDGERGIIINTSSIAGYQGKPNRVAYATSKAAIIGMTYPLAKELGEHGIRVVDIAPGPFETNLTGDLPKDPTALGLSFVFPKRRGRPNEFGSFVKSVIETSMLNGSSVRLDGAVRL